MQRMQISLPCAVRASGETQDYDGDGDEENGDFDRDE